QGHPVARASHAVPHSRPRGPELHGREIHPRSPPAAPRRRPARSPHESGAIPQAATPRGRRARSLNRQDRTMLHTPICEMFGIKYPIWRAGVGGVSMAPLVAAVSNAGGLGVIGAATLSANGLRREIRKTRELTDKPFAVDLLAPIPDMIRPQMQVVFEERIEIFVAGLAVPREFIA